MLFELNTFVVKFSFEFNGFMAKVVLL